MRSVYKQALTASISDNPVDHPTGTYTMHAIVGFTLVPMGTGTSVSAYVAAVQRVLEQSGLNFEINCNSTNIEGDWEEVFAAIKRCHEIVHGEGAPRIHTCLQVGTRVDREQRMAEKLESVVKTEKVTSVGNSSSAPGE